MSPASAGDGHDEELPDLGDEALEQQFATDPDPKDAAAEARALRWLERPKTPENAERALQWGVAARGRVLRGDRMIGIMGQREFDAIPRVLTWAGDAGAVQGYLQAADVHLEDGEFGLADEVFERARLTDPAMTPDWFRHRMFRLADVRTAEQQADDVATLRSYLAEHSDDGDAAHLAGLALYRGYGGPADVPAAFAAQQHAAQLGEPDAHFELYVLYVTGQGTAADEAKAVEHLRIAADLGQPRAMYNLGAAYATRHSGFEQNSAKAVEWYTKAAEAGSGKAAATLGGMYALGDGVELDVVQADRWLDEAEILGEDVTPWRVLLGDLEPDEGSGDDDQAPGALSDAEVDAMIADLQGGRARDEERWREDPEREAPGDPQGPTVTGRLGVVTSDSSPAASRSGGFWVWFKGLFGRA